MINVSGEPHPINLQDAFGYTALIYAARVGPLEVVRLLVEAGADVNAQDSNGNTALSIALQRDRSEIAEYLRENGATE